MFRMTKPAVAGIALVAVAACAKKEAAVDTTAAKAADTTAAAAATPMPDSTKTLTSSKWTPGVTVGFAETANQGEIALGKLGETKATNSEVKGFAKEMVTDHTKMLAESKALAKKLSAAADTTADDVKDLMGHAKDELKDLTDKAKGADWDKNYMDKMVEDHQNVLGKLQDAAKSNSDTTMTKALSDATAKVQEHLTKAQAIRAKLP